MRVREAAAAASTKDRRRFEPLQRPADRNSQDHHRLQEGSFLVVRGGQCSAQPDEHQKKERSEREQANIAGCDGTLPAQHHQQSPNGGEQIYELLADHGAQAERTVDGFKFYRRSWRR
jgi:hypothetical protein